MLEPLPEEIVPKAEPRLTFIIKSKLKTSIARDIDSLDAVGRDEEWKAATVIGGSVVEAPCDKGTALAAVAALENLVATFNGSR